MLKKIVVTALNAISVVLAQMIRLFHPLYSKFSRLWHLTLLRSKVINAVPNTTQLDGRVHVIGTGKIKLGEYCRIGNNVILETQENGSITLGNHVRINQGSVLVAYDQMTIGDDCLIGEYCSIRDANHGIELNTPIRIQPHTHASITIENDCWIARGVTILKGVHVHQGSVIGANSVVTKDISDQSISVGIPAKVIRARKQGIY
ncbi:acyltransferase [Methylobacter sp. YRD-M1]|uniref:acyltransferase n=1 Tax=Methylobacter sp. YRD-M1 TaxID=2911520 RepID=UPI00227B27AF|nr:acyltransferase [Methylobacter sp. YRD-M1]WAK01136.1 acyltransferase [Methylobacter sp. YRD-M1]